MLLAFLLLISAPSEEMAVSATPGGVECIYFNEEYLICHWDSKGTPSANYSMYYWYSSNDQSISECQRYLRTEDGITVGCRLDYNITDYIPFFVLLNGTHTDSIHSNLGLLMNLVKPAPPFNVTIQDKNESGLELNWKTPYHDPSCLEHVVKYRSDRDSEWTEQKTNGMKFNIPSVDPVKFYTFYVRSKISMYCGSTTLWSELSDPIFWGRKTTAGSDWFWIQNVLVPIGSFLLLVVFLMLLMRMESVWLVLMPRIPNPGKKFEDLFSAHQGNFSEWAGVSKDAVESFKPDYRESICRVSELLPGGGYLPVSNDATGKAGRGSVGTTDHIPKISPE